MLINTRIFLFSCFIILLSIVSTLSYSKDNDKQLFGIVTSMPSENTSILNLLENKKTTIINKVIYTEGKLSGKKVVIVTTEIGKINAANVTSRLIGDYHPSYVIVAGIAGAINPNLEIGDIVVGQEMYNAEHLAYNGKTDSDDITAINNKITPAEIYADNNFLNDIKKKISIPKYHILYGLIATTDIFPQSSQQLKEMRNKKIDALEMEGFAVMQVCWLYDTPCLVVRSISDCPLKEINNDKNIKKDYEISIDGKKLAEKNISILVNKLLAIM